MITDDQIRALVPYSRVQIDGTEHLIGNIPFEVDPETDEIIRASVYSVTEQRWLILRAPKRALNDPRVDCCGWDASDCDCYPKTPRYLDRIPHYDMPNADAEY